MLYYINSRYISHWILYQRIINIVLFGFYLKISRDLSCAGKRKTNESSNMRYRDSRYNVALVTRSLKTSFPRFSRIELCIILSSPFAKNGPLCSTDFPIS